MIAALLVMAASLLAGWSATIAAAEVGKITMDEVTGTVAYRERIALPPTALIKVQLVDVSRADAPAEVLGEQVFEAGGKQVPFAFAIRYDPARILPNHSYAVQARIEEGRQLRYINDRGYPVITRGAPSSADLVLRAAGAR